jgi:hypothetical protein
MAAHRVTRWDGRNGHTALVSMTPVGLGKIKIPLGQWYTLLDALPRYFDVDAPLGARHGIWSGRPGLGRAEGTTATAVAGA